MIEIGSLLGFIFVRILVDILCPPFYGEIMCITTSLCLSFVLFGRAIKYILKDRSMEVNRRSLLLCIFYFLMLCMGSGFMYCYTKADKAGTYVTVRGLSHVMNLVLYLLVKIEAFRRSSLYYKPYKICQILDGTLLGGLTIVSLTSEYAGFSNKLATDLVTISLVILAIESLIIDVYKPYWLHKRALLSKLDYKIKSKEILEFVKNPKTTKQSCTIREMAYVLDLAPVRVIELNMLTRYLHNSMLKYGWTKIDSTNICADFSSMTIKSLMKRNYDFMLLPRPIIKLMQTYKNHPVENKRSFLIDL